MKAVISEIRKMKFEDLNVFDVFFYASSRDCPMVKMSYSKGIRQETFNKAITALSSEDIKSAFSEIASGVGDFDGKTEVNVIGQIRLIDEPEIKKES